MRTLIQLINSQSAKTRFVATFGTNILKGILSLSAGLMVARALGPAKYGDFNFLLVSFAAISRLLDMGTSSAFYTFISRKKRAKKFYMYYLIWICLQFVFALFLITILLPDTLKTKIWLGQDRLLISLSFIASFTMGQIWEMTASIGESIRKTILVQARNIGLSLTYIIIVYLLIIFNCMEVTNLLITHIILYSSFSILLFICFKNDIFGLPNQSESLKSIFYEFKEYCVPLTVTVWISFLFVFADRWMLQKFGGAIQQGYYSVGERFSIISLLAVTSILRVFWKETAEAFENNDNEKIRRLYLKTCRIFFLSRP